MDPQDQNSPSTASISPVLPDIAPPAPAAPPVTSAAAPTPFPVAQVPTYNAQHVQIEGDVQAVPQENIGLGQEASAIPPVPEYQAEVAVPGVLPVPADRLTAPAEVFPEAPESSQSSESLVVTAPTAPQPTLDIPSVSPAITDPLIDQTAEPPAEGAENGESQKTPLEILEEILASANENPAEGAPGAGQGGGEADTAAADAQALVEEEAKKAAALAAETERYQQEAAQRITLAQQDLQEAAQQRVDVTQQLQSEGKQVGATVTTPEDQAFAIQQLEHDTLTQKSE